MVSTDEPFLLSDLGGVLAVKKRKKNQPKIADGKKEGHGRKKKRTTWPKREEVSLSLILSFFCVSLIPNASSLSFNGIVLVKVHFQEACKGDSISLPFWSSMHKMRCAYPSLCTVYAVYRPRSAPLESWAADGMASWEPAGPAYQARGLYGVRLLALLPHFRRPFPPRV